LIFWDLRSTSTFFRGNNELQGLSANEETDVLGPHCTRRSAQTEKFRAAYPSFDPRKTGIVSPSQDEDDEHEKDDDSMASPAAGSSSSSSPAICATPTSVGKRPMSSELAASAVKRPSMQAKLSSFFQRD